MNLTTDKLSNLIDKNKLGGEIRFIHFRDNKPHTFHSYINEMSGNRLSAFDNNPPTINDELSWIRSVFTDIHNKSPNIISCEGNICPICKLKQIRK